MRTVYEQRTADAREIEGQLSTGRAKIVTTQFGAVARVLWPVKTAATIAAIGNSNERTAKRWLAGEFEPPFEVVHAVMGKIFRRQ